MTVVKVKLREFLRDRGLSAYRLAKRVDGVSPKTVYAVSAGRARPSLDALGKIVDALREMTSEEIQPADLLEFVPEPRRSATAGSGDWLAAMAQTMASGIDAAEEAVPAHELRAWLAAMEAAAKPLDG